MQAEAARRKLQALADQSSSGSSDGAKGGQSTGSEIVFVGRFPLGADTMAGPEACPAPAVHAFLHDMASTHPCLIPRLIRIDQLSGQLPMLLRAAGPPVAVNGKYSHASVAEQVAEQLAAGLAAEAAAKAAAAQAAEAAAREAGNAAESAALAGTLVAGVATAAAAAAVAVADNRPS